MSQTILVPVDLADDHPRELRFAADLAKRLGAEVLLLHVVDYVPTVLPVELPAGYPMPQLDVVKQSAATKLAKVAKHFGDVPVRCIVEIGTAAHEIVACAEREKVDQIVVGSHTHSAIARMVLGSVAERVARTAPCPVTIVRERTNG